jgi:DNA-binding NarL/FixJ family response regulator
MSTRLILVDDHPMLRQGLRQALAPNADLVIAGEVSSGRAALQMVRELTPDLVIMDIHLPDLNGLEVSRLILRDFPRIKIIVFSADPDRTLVDEALQTGICGYLVKAGVVEEMIRAIRLVMEGRLYLCPELATVVLDNYKKQLVSKTRSAKSLLTDREKQVLRWLAEGLQNKEIADRLNVSLKSVEKSRFRLMHKLGYRSVAELTRYAVREKIAPP